MPAELLADLPAHSFVFVDSNILIYGLSGASGQCRHLLDRCQREEITGITLYETINELTHRLMVTEALKRSVLQIGYYYIYYIS
jgi:predicted nucleic acid-binding protein